MPPNLWADDLGTDMVTFLVGPNQTKFVVHKNLLTLHSTHFQKALSSGSKDKAEGIITLEQDDPAALKIIIEFLYTGQIPDFLKNKSDAKDFYAVWDDAESRREALTYQLLLLKVCVLAETWTWAGLFNTAIDSFIAGQRNITRYEMLPIMWINTAYSGTPPGSPLRRLICHLVSCEYRKPGGPSVERRRAFLDHASEHFVLDLLGGKAACIMPDKEEPLPQEPCSRNKGFSCEVAGFFWFGFWDEQWLVTRHQTFPRFHQPNFDE